MSSIAPTDAGPQHGRTRAARIEARCARPGLPRRRCSCRCCCRLLILIVLLGHHAGRRMAGAVDAAGRLRHERRLPARHAGRGSPRHRRFADPDRVRGRGRDADRHRRRDLPAGVRARHPAQPVPHHQHPQPRRRALDRVRHPRARGVRAGDARGHRSRQLRAELHLGRPDARRARPADHHPDHDGGAARGAQEHPGGGLRRRGDAVGGRAEPRAAVRGARRSSRARSCRSPERSARRRRCCWSAPSPGYLSTPSAVAPRSRSCRASTRRCPRRSSPGPGSRARAGRPTRRRRSSCCWRSSSS